jgi:flavin reductase (DIM6/NTAB) family NADH-FMN oxidoreductase RutF
MRRLIHAVLHGQPLRHRPIALRLDDQQQVRVVLAAAGGMRDVTHTLFPAALKPFTIGVHADPDTDGLPDSWEGELRFEDVGDGTLIGAIAVVPDRSATDPDAPIRLMRPAGSDMPSELSSYRAWRHFLAWRHTQAGARAAHNFQMSYPDLRALNAFYVLPRPVFLVSVAAGDRSNMFPMDLVAPIGRDRFVLALRRTSPSVETMCASRQVVISGAPAAFKDVAYQLGAHHKKATIDWSTLPFALTASREFGIPRPVESTILRELHIEQYREIGSHMFFQARIVHQEVPSDLPQLCHVSDMYARWRHRRGRPFLDA